jgi:predicted DNA-binding transcriptional regulator YafY
MAKRVRATARRPTYGAATRLARLLLGLQGRAHGWSFAAVQEELGISERTLLRYLAIGRRELVDADGQPVIESVKRGAQRFLRLSQATQLGESTVYQVLFFYFAQSVFQFLDGTVIRDGVDDLWERFLRSVPGAQRARLSDFRRKFFAVPHAMKDYSAADATLDTIVWCLVYERRMRIDYGGLLGAGKTHDFDPYTLLMYRGGLYVLGRSHRGRKIIALAVERMRKVERLPDHFDYPAGYSPEKHTEGIFGLIEGPDTTVELLITNPETHAYLSSRRLHPSQVFRARKRGGWVLSLNVRGTAELRYWILGLGPHVEVLKPASLREEVAAMLRQAAGQYRETSTQRRRGVEGTE